MKEFITYLEQVFHLNEHQIAFVVCRAKELNLQKDDFFSEAGKVPREVGFIIEGIFRYCYYNDKGEEITNYFVGENNFITDYPNFEANTISGEYIQAVTSCQLLVFSKKDWVEISNELTQWNHLIDRNYNQCLLDAIGKRSPLVSEDATTRYLSFLKNFPSFVNRIPLSYVASYLGITQQSLSRIRKNIA